MELKDLKACSWSCKIQLQNFKHLVLVKDQSLPGKKRLQKSKSVLSFYKRSLGTTASCENSPEIFFRLTHKINNFTQNTVMMANSVSPKYHVKYIRLRSMVTKSTEMMAFQFKQSTVLKF